MRSVLLVFGFILAAGLGGSARWFALRLTARPDFAIVAVNIVGSFLLGLTHNASTEWRLILGTALLGAFTTFSTFALNVVRLSPKRSAAMLLGTTVTGCISMAWLGMQLAL